MTFPGTPSFQRSHNARPTAILASNTFVTDVPFVLVSKLNRTNEKLEEYIRVLFFLAVPVRVVGVTPEVEAVLHARRRYTCANNSCVTLQFRVKPVQERYEFLPHSTL